MIKIYIWFNPNTKSFYEKQCKNCHYNVGDYNQFGHLLVSSYTVFRRKAFANLSDLQLSKMIRRWYKQ